MSTTSLTTWRQLHPCPSTAYWLPAPPRVSSGLRHLSCLVLNYNLVTRIPVGQTPPTLYFHGAASVFGNGNLLLCSAIAEPRKKGSSPCLLLLAHCRAKLTNVRDSGCESNCAYYVRVRSCNRGNCNYSGQLEGLNRTLEPAGCDVACFPTSISWPFWLAPPPVDQLTAWLRKAKTDCTCIPRLGTCQAKLPMDHGVCVRHAMFRTSLSSYDLIATLF